MRVTSGAKLPLSAGLMNCHSVGYGLGCWVTAFTAMEARVTFHEIICLPGYERRVDTPAQSRDLIQNVKPLPIQYFAADFVVDLAANLAADPALNSTA